MMENFRHCPICTEVPEREVYQCSEGHIICHLCISKVAGGRCPQCRILFGVKKIRSRVLEVFLEGQEFECKFKDNGCAHLCKRGEMTSHANACSFNPDTVPLYQLLGAEDCAFRVGTLSRAEILAHFETVHGLYAKILPAGTWATLYSRENITNLMIRLKSRKRKVNQALQIDCGLVAPSGSETSPLFLFCSFHNRPRGFLSLFCFKVWDEETNPSSKFKVKFELCKGSASGPSPDPFPIGGSMKVCSLKKADRILEATPINVALSLLEESQFGATEGDRIRVKISEIV